MLKEFIFCIALAKKELVQLLSQNLKMLKMNLIELKLYT